MSKITTGLMIVVAASTFLFAACSKQNPLDKPNKKAVAEFLVKTAKAAEKKVEPNASSYTGGTYRACMEGQYDKNKCQALYKEMLIVARQNKDYSSLTMAELTDQKTWGLVRDDFTEISFNTL